MPIIPDYLCTLDANTTTGAGKEEEEEDENGRVGLLLSSKALVQLILNPAVGTLTGNLGYARPLFLGNLSLLLAALRKLQMTFFMATVRHADGVNDAREGDVTSINRSEIANIIRKLEKKQEKKTPARHVCRREKHVLSSVF